MPEKKQPLNCLLVVLAKQNQQDLAIFCDIVFKKTIIPLVLVGYEMSALLAIYHLISNTYLWNNC